MLIFWLYFLGAVVIFAIPPAVLPWLVPARPRWMLAGFLTGLLVSTYAAFWLLRFEWERGNDIGFVFLVGPVGVAVLSAGMCGLFSFMKRLSSVKERQRARQ